MVGACRVAVDFGRFHRGRRGWNKARVLNATDVHLLVACLPAWCSYPWTADARPDPALPSFTARVCVCTRVGARREVGGGRRVGKQVAPKPQPWAVAVKYCGCFKNRSSLPRPPLALPSRQSSAETRSLSTLRRKICQKMPRLAAPTRNSRESSVSLSHGHPSPLLLRDRAEFAPL